MLLTEDSQHVKRIIATIVGEGVGGGGGGGGGVIKDLENNKSTQSMFNKTALVQTSINKILINMIPYNRWQIQNKVSLKLSSSSYHLVY